MIKKDLELKYDKDSGYAGTAVAGSVVAEVSALDRILVVQHSGVWFVRDLPEKVFVGEKAWLGVADKEALSKTVFTIVYRDKAGLACIKRCIIEGWIMNKEYSLVPEGAEALFISTKEKFSFTLHYIPKPRLRALEEEFKAHKFAVKGIKAAGVRLSGKAVKKAVIQKGEK